MSAFVETNWETLMPSYLVSAEKGRLTEALKQFKDGTKSINYSEFYLNRVHDYFLQGDIIEDIRIPVWNSTSYEANYTNAIIISNTCDIAKDNKRGINTKQCLFAPVIQLDAYLDALIAEGFTKDEIANFKTDLITQKISNLIFLPDRENWETGYIALLDQLFWFPTEDLNEFWNFGSTNDDVGRIYSLDNFGFYLFALKLSYHLCRLPEEEYRNPPD